MSGNVHYGSIHVRSLANVLQAWLGYLYEVSKIEKLINEGLCRFPISGFLERQENAHLFLEEPHPLYDSKRVDFMWKNDKIKEDEAGSTIYIEATDFCYMEAKFIHDYTGVDIQAIMDDIFRLVTLGKDHQYAYFLLYGESDDFNKKIVKYQLPEGVISKKNCFANILPLKEGRKLTVKLNDTNSFLSNFNSRYVTKENKVIKSIQICATLQMPYDRGLKGAVAIWEICPLKIHYVKKKLTPYVVASKP